MATKKVKAWWKSKTLLLASLQGLAGVLAVVLVENPEMKVAGLLAILKSLVDALLRANTNEAIK